MGLSWSKRRNNTNNLHHQNPSPSQLLSSYPSNPTSLPSSSSPPPPSLPPPPPPPSLPPPPLLPPPRPPPAPPQPPQPPNYYFNANSPYTSPPYPLQNHYPVLPPHPIPHNPYYYQFSGIYSNCGNVGQISDRSNYHPYHSNQSNWWPGPPGIRPPLGPPQQPPPYVDHQQAKKVRNDVNVHKGTIKIEVDEKNPEYHLVSFIFDALVDGSITIFYFAKEGSNCRYTPLYPDACMPVTVPFQKGLGQKFCQPSGTGIDLGFFELDDLSKPSPSEDVFPLVIFAEACQPPLAMVDQPDQILPTTSHAQITEAVLEKNNGGAFQVKIIKQILWIDGVRYELREIYGISNSAEANFDDNDSGKECVICMSEPKDTAVLPCRHMCMCSECAKELRLQTNKCPICRQPIEELIEIKVNGHDQ
ncbi:zinc finger protein [Macleaya cordata]|uniref:RING-type E3 ubiquitin transferase n=1 Tax=Macleaya cordata TaxID=56857 RepID=A0A200PXQ7_MACCD|nr:zinc finger protein [Macleaya cordata]